MRVGAMYNAGSRKTAGDPMKRYITFSLSLVMIFILVACDNDAITIEEYKEEYERILNLWSSESDKIFADWSTESDRLLDNFITESDQLFHDYITDINIFMDKLMADEISIEEFEAEYERIEKKYDTELAELADNYDAEREKLDEIYDLKMAEIEKELEEEIAMLDDKKIKR